MATTSIFHMAIIRTGILVVVVVVVVVDDDEIMDTPIMDTLASLEFGERIASQWNKQHGSF
jgi:hypothetical protein